MQKKVDDLVMKAAVNLSRRSFFTKLGGIGLGTGLGLAGIGAAHAGCGNCGDNGCSEYMRSDCFSFGGSCQQNIFYDCLDLCLRPCQKTRTVRCTGC